MFPVLPAYSISRMSTDVACTLQFSLSLSLLLALFLSLCGFYNQIRVDVSLRIWGRTRLREPPRIVLDLLSGIYVLRLMWAVGSDDKCALECPYATHRRTQPDFVNRLTQPSFLLRSFIRSNTPWTQLTSKLDKRHSETIALLGFASHEKGNFLNINLVSAGSQLYRCRYYHFLIKTNYY